MTQAPVLGPEHWRKRAREVAIEKGLDPYRFSRLIEWESGFKPSAGPGGAGEIGLGQFTPEWIGAGEEDWRYDPEVSLQRSAQYVLEHYSQFGDWRQAYAAYAYGATGFQANVLDVYGEDWEQNIESSQARKLAYIFGGAATERALTPVAQAGIPGMSVAAQRAIAISGGPKPPISGFEDIPEFFTGYRKLLYDALHQTELLRTATQETESNYNQQQQRYLQPLGNEEIRAYMKMHGYTDEQIGIFMVPPMPGEEGTGIRAQLEVPTRAQILSEVREFRRYEIEAQTNFHQMAIDEYKRADTMATIIQWLPWAMVDGDVSTVQDVEKFFTDFNPQGPPDMSVDPAMTRMPFKLNQEDREFISDLMARLSPALDIAPDVEASTVVAALMDEAWQTPKVMSAMTQQQIQRFFFSQGQALEAPYIEELGRRLTDSELRGVLSDFEMDDEEQRERISGTKAVATRLVQDWYTRDMIFRTYRAGIRVPEIPKLSALAKLNMLWQQPALAGAEIANLFREKWSMPIAGMAVMDINRIGQFFGAPPVRGTEKLEESYRKSRSEGMSNWESYGQAFEDWDAPWGLEFAIEVAADPITYLGLGFYTGATRGIPVVGPIVKAAERGWIEAWNLPFAGLKKAYTLGVPRTLDQIASARARTWFESFNDTFATRLSREAGLVGADPEEMAVLTREALREYITDPGRAGGKLWEFGQKTYQYLKRFIGPDEVKDWSREVGGKAPLTRQMTQDINYIYESLQGSGIHGVLKTSEAAPLALRILGADDVAENIAKMSRLLSGRLARDVDSIFSMFRGTANESLVRVGQRIESTFLQNAKSEVWRFSEQSGMAMSLGAARKADALLNWKGAQLLDQLAVRPMASMYLLFLNYGPFNWLETVFRAGRGGAGFIGNPRGNVVDEVMETWGYLRLPHDLRFGGPRLEVAVAPGKGETIYEARKGKGLLPLVTREAPIENIPLINKVPRQLWSLQNWNDMWARVGQRQRAVYVHRKMMKRMAELAPDEMKLIGEATGDIHKAGLKSFSRDNLDEIGERVATAAIHSPDSVRGMRVTAESMQARKYRSEIATMFDKFPEIEAAYQNRIIRLADRGELPGNVDRIIEETFNAATDDYLSKLPARAEQLRRWVRELTEGMPRPFDQTGYRGGYMRPTRGDLATEGEGLYIWHDRQAAVDWATGGPAVREGGEWGVHEVRYKSPRKVLEGDSYPLMEEDPKLFEPIGASDSEWMRLNKQAAKNAGLSLDNWTEKSKSAFTRELRQLVNSSGYDAVSFEARGFTVLMDDALWGSEKLTAEEAVGLVRKLSDTRDVVDDVVEQHRKVATERGHDVNMEARDQIHTQAHADMIDFFSALDDIDQFSILLKDRIAQLPDKKAGGLLTDLVDNLGEQQRLMISTRNKERAIITEAKATAPGRAVDWHEVNTAREALWNSEYWPKVRSLRTEYQTRAGTAPGAVPFGTIDPVIGDLAPAHVARLFATTGDDLSRSLTHTETMTVMGKDRFVDRVRVQADILASELGKTAEELGFSDKAIARVYDQLMAKLRFDPAVAKTLEPLKQSFEGVRQRIHEITNLRALPEGEAEAFNSYLEGVAGRLHKSGMFQPTDPVALTFTQDLEKSAAEQFPHTIEDMRKIASGKGTIKLYHGTSGEAADRMVSKGIELPQDATVVAQELADVYGFPLKDFMRQPLVRSLVRGYGTSVSTLSTTTAEVAARWAAYPHGELRTAINEFAMLYKAAREQGTTLGRYMDALEKRFPDAVRGEYVMGQELSAGGVRGLVRVAGLEDLLKTARTGEGALLEVTADVSAIPSRIKKEAEWMLGRKDFSAEDLAQWNSTYRDIALDPRVVRSPRVVLRKPLPDQMRTTNWEAAPGWSKVREQAMDDVRVNFELDFTDYSHQNMFDAFMRRLMPFWTYESQRWPYLARAAVQTPGVFTSWGKYMDHSDTGYMHIPGTDLQLNPFRGTVFMGGLRRFYMRDYPEYYDKFKPWAEYFDYAGRAGFYPGIHISLPIAIWGGENPQIGEVMPAFVRTGLGALVGMGVPGAQALQETIFPERFRNYEIGLVVSRLAQKRELDISGPDLWRKQQQGLTLDPDEQALWDEATRYIGRLAIMREQTGLFRMAPEERIKAWKEQAKVREALTGISVEMQEAMRLREPSSGERFADLFPLDPMQQEQLNELDAMKYWLGSISPLLPSEYQEVYARIAQYYEEVETIFEELRTVGYTDEESGRRWPSTKELHDRFISGEISATNYTRLIGESIEEAVSRSTGLRESEVFADVPMTMEDRIDFAEEHNLPQPTFHPGQELIYEYYNLTPMLTQDEEGNLTYDYFTYFSQVDAILDAMPEPIKSQFIAHIQREWTPTQKLYWATSKEYMRPYRNLREAAMEQFPPEQRAILRQYSKVTDLVERERLMAITLPDGSKLIATFNKQLKIARANLRAIDPELDAWMAFWGKTSTFKTRQAKLRYIELMHTHRPGAALEVEEVEEFLSEST